MLFRISQSSQNFKCKRAQCKGERVVVVSTLLSRKVDLWSAPPLIDRSDPSYRPHHLKSAATHLGTKKAPQNICGACLFPCKRKCQLKAVLISASANDQK